MMNINQISLILIILVIGLLGLAVAIYVGISMGYRCCGPNLKNIRSWPVAIRKHGRRLLGYTDYSRSENRRMCNDNAIGKTGTNPLNFTYNCTFQISTIRRHVRRWLGYSTDCGHGSGGIENSENLGEPTGTNENSGEPAGTNENSGEPTGTNENSGEPTGTTENSGEPTGTNENSGEPTGTNENSGEPTGTNENSGELAGTNASATIQFSTGTSGNAGGKIGTGINHNVVNQTCNSDDMVVENGTSDCTNDNARAHTNNNFTVPRQTQVIESHTLDPTSYNHNRTPGHSVKQSTITIKSRIRRLLGYTDPPSRNPNWTPGLDPPIYSEHDNNNRNFSIPSGQVIQADLTVPLPLAYTDYTPCQSFQEPKGNGMPYILAPSPPPYGSNPPAYRDIMQQPSEPSAEDATQI